ncbi:multidrug resistance protein [Seiridium cupressi]
MRELLRDTVFSHTLRLITGGRVFKYPEELDPSLWEKYVHSEKSANIAHHGQIEAPEPSSQENLANGERDESPYPRDSSATAVDHDTVANGERSRHVDPEKGKDYYIVDWYGPNDPEKFFVTFEICFLTFSGYIGSAISSAGIVDVMSHFGVSQVATTLGLTLFVAGYGLGPMLWSPMSEIPQTGRNPIYIITLALFVVLQVPTALTTNFGMLLAFRFLTGFIGSPSLATGGARIGDMYSPAKRTYGLAVWGMGAAQLWDPWSAASQQKPRGGAGPSANILYRRARRLRKLTGNDKLICEPELQGQEMTGKDILQMTLVRPFTLLFAEPIVLALDLYIALIYGLLYIWFESFPIVFEGIYGFSLGIEGLAFLGILIGVFVVLPPFVWYQHKYIEPKFNENGELKPEWRLPPSFVGAFAIPICLFWFGWSSRPDIHWIVPIIGTAWFSIGAFLLFNTVMNYLSDAYPAHVASVLAGNDLLRSMVVAGFVSFTPFPAAYTNARYKFAISILTLS